MVTYEVISREEFEQVAPKALKPPSEWEPVLDQLEQGKAVRIRLEDESKHRGARLALGRRAVGRGFKVEMRHADGVIVARRTDAPVVPTEPKPRTPRRRKSTEDPATVDP